MFSQIALITVTNAQAVANAVAYFLSHPPDVRFFRLDAVPPDRQSDVTTFWVRPRQERPITDLADGVEIAHCVTKDGKRLDIVLGLPVEREIKPAALIVEPS